MTSKAGLRNQNRGRLSLPVAERERENQREMDAAAGAEPEAKRQCNAVATLYPLKSVGKLRERYTEDTADVFFVEKETKERLPAHRELLKVASTVFYRMFSGDWKEKEEKEIPAPEDFIWKSFKAAIALLYGEEVEVVESVIPDLYRVAHYYDLRAVMSVFAHSIQVWDHRQLSTVVELCALAGEVEAEQEQKENELIQAAVKYIAHHLDDIREMSVDIAGLSYQAMLMLVQCEHITVVEWHVLLILNQWMDAHQDISVEKAQEVYSHVRYGTLHYENLLDCQVFQANYDAALMNHRQMQICSLNDNILQITPREGQREVFQVFPMEPGMAIARQVGVQRFFHVSTPSAVGVVYSGRQECVFEADLNVHTCVTSSLVCELCSVTEEEEPLVMSEMLYDPVVDVSYDKVFVTFYAFGARVVLQSGDEAHSKNMNMSFSGTFPWVLTFGVNVPGLTYSFALTHYRYSGF